MIKICDMQGDEFAGGVSDSGEQRRVAVDALSIIVVVLDTRMCPKRRLCGGGPQSAAVEISDRVVAVLEVAGFPV